MPVSEGMLRALFDQMSAAPTGATQLAPGQRARVGIDVPDTALEVTEMLTRTLNLEWIGKDVRFFNPDLLPQPLRATLQAPGQIIRQAIGIAPVRQLIELFAPGTKGTLSQIAATLQTPVSSPVPVSFSWRWTVTDAAGATVNAGQGFLSPEGLTVPQTSFMFKPPVRKLEDQDFAPDTFNIRGGVRLQAGAIDTGWLDFPDLPFLVAPLQVPTVLALFVNRNFQNFVDDTEGAVLVMLPEGSPLHAVSAVTQALNTAGSALQAIGTLLSLFPLGAATGTITAPISNAAHTSIVVQDDIANLNDQTLIQREWFENDTEAEDEISSLILVGVPGTRVRLFNARNFGTNEGVLEVTTGPEGYVLIRNLDSASPATEPPGRATPVNPSPWNTFRDTFSSVRFM
jgi:hypothetical protein